MASNFFTAFHRALQDPEAYYSFQKEMNSKAVEQVFFNFYGGVTTFEAIILPSELGRPTYETSNDGAIRVRPIGIHDFIIPEPCIFEGDREKIQKLINLHPVAYPDIRGQQPSTERPDASFQVGQTVYCSLVDGSSYKLTYQRDKKNTTSAIISFPCLTNPEGKSSKSLKEVFAKGGATTLGTPDLTAAQGAVSKGLVSVPKWDTLKEIAKSGIFNSILDHIALHESGGSYDIYNLGACSDCGFKGDATIKTLYGANLSQLSIATVKQKVMTNKSINGKAVFATGKYQIIPSTLERAIKEIPGCDTSEPYGKEQQDAFGLYLVFFRRKTLGKYLLGESVRVEDAQLSLAQEWASVHILEPVVRKGSAKQKTKGHSFRPDVQLQRYQSYYANYQLYKWNATTNDWDVQSDSNPDNANKTRALKTKKILEDQRKNFLESPNAEDIKKKFGLK